METCTGPIPNWEILTHGREATCPKSMSMDTSVVFTLVDTEFVLQMARDFSTSTLSSTFTIQVLLKCFSLKRTPQVHFPNNRWLNWSVNGAGSDCDTSVLLHATYVLMFQRRMAVDMHFPANQRALQHLVVFVDSFIPRHCNPAHASTRGGLATLFKFRRLQSFKGLSDSYDTVAVDLVSTQKHHCKLVVEVTYLREATVPEKISFSTT